MIEKIRYFIKEGLRSIWINRVMSLASLLVLCICLLMLGTSYIASLSISGMIDKLESKNQIMVYLNRNLKQSDIDKIGEKIQDIPTVESSKFISKQDIFDQAKETLDKQKILLSGIDASAFDDAYQVNVSRSEEYEQTVRKLEKIDGVKYIRQDAGLAGMLSNIKRAVNFAGFWLFMILAVVSLFIISNTIKLAMFNRKREINIMKFVGATDWFIRWPFIIEGLLIGLISGVVALVLQYFIYIKIIASVVSMLSVVSLIDYSSILWIIIPGFLLGGMVVGILGSVVSVRKYLKV